ncbi:pyocin knob domain-containing protein [Rhodoplanes sp. TEM]|uniref:Pyocin knob domain-containing protein n=1 Tax=Rhodoplanes tepidamans TaxID=200616 RepID=A0ABT5JE57_RHOTP|nr:MULTISPECIES: pyocin knob domain-containing protein [Rhodoplanes]MDC7787370.1 pyocin knob domain-containing protein [Rhodoplanes tepidamans]MDC7984748.1 pyocin knob domain-containing protein [Rhodoplanes sp. TEM]MDQ0358281.1 hypothetical protein [Rhodoplanes tepidamans]
MAAKIKLLRSTIAGHVPAALESGQIAINEADGRLFWRGPGGAVQALDLTLADQVDGDLAALNASIGTALAAKLDAAAFTAASVLAKLLTVDGSGSGLDADTLRGTTPGAFGLDRLADADAAAAVTALANSGLAEADGSNLTGRLGAAAKLTTDWNAATENGWWYSDGATALNSPESIGLIGMVVTMGAAGIRQTLWRVAAGGFGYYQRHRVGGVWDAWALSPGASSSTAQAQAGVNDTTIMTPLKTAQAIAALAPATGQPIPTASNDFKVGSTLVLIVVGGTGNTTANNATIAGSNLRMLRNVGDPLTNNNPGLSGTWQNISGGTVGYTEVGYFVRIA